MSMLTQEAIETSAKLAVALNEPDANLDIPTLVDSGAQLSEAAETIEKALEGVKTRLRLYAQGMYQGQKNIEIEGSRGCTANINFATERDLHADARVFLHAVKRLGLTKALVLYNIRPTTTAPQIEKFRDIIGPRPEGRLLSRAARLRAFAYSLVDRIEEKLGTPRITFGRKAN